MIALLPYAIPVMLAAAIFYGLIAVILHMAERHEAVQSFSTWFIPDGHQVAATEADLMPEGFDLGRLA